MINEFLDDHWIPNNAYNRAVPQYLESIVDCLLANPSPIDPESWFSVFARCPLTQDRLKFLEHTEALDIQLDPARYYANLGSSADWMEGALCQLDRMANEYRKLLKCWDKIATLSHPDALVRARNGFTASAWTLDAVATLLQKLESYERGSLLPGPPPNWKTDIVVICRLLVPQLHMYRAALPPNVDLPTQGAIFSEVFRQLCDYFTGMIPPNVPIAEILQTLDEVDKLLTFIPGINQTTAFRQLVENHVDWAFCEDENQLAPWLSPKTLALVGPTYRTEIGHAVQNLVIPLLQSWSVYYSRGDLIIKTNRMLKIAFDSHISLPDSGRLVLAELKKIQAYVDARNESKYNAELATMAQWITSSCQNAR